MEVVISAGGLPFGPTTLQYRSLGGSETAAMQLAIEMRKLDHSVTIFCNLPPAGHPDFQEPGHPCSDGVRWCSIEQYGAFISNTEVDLLIVSRDPTMLALPHQAKKAIFWMHDLATIKTFKPRLMDVSWNFDEIWTVSEYHRQQVHETTGYPLTNIVATRNGIVKFDIMDIPREPKTLLYSARPERGLENLVKPGGIMERLPDFKLRVTMYENYPDHMMEYYHTLWNFAEKLPNVELLGPKTQIELRQLMKATWAYIYPTEFEEVSCIIARECIEQELPVITTAIGALPETLDKCAIYYECGRDTIGTEEFCKGFADLVKNTDDGYTTGTYANVQSSMRARTDLYWDKVAESFANNAAPVPHSPYSQALSMIKDSDIIAAWDVLINAPSSPGIIHLRDEIYTKYPFLFGDKTFEEHYDAIYVREEAKGVPERQKMLTLEGTPRYEAIKEQIPEGAKRIVEYGCAEGPILFGLVKAFPNTEFVGIDISQANVDLCTKRAAEAGMTNVKFYKGDVASGDWPKELSDDFDVGIISEVLEHVEHPWECLDFLESNIRPGGRMIGTVPTGPWEFSGLRSKENWDWRAHIWHLNKAAIRGMLKEKSDCALTTITHSHFGTRAMGHLAFGYEADEELVHPIVLAEKAEQHRCRDSIAACMIAMDDEDSILKCLNSIHNIVDTIQIAIGPSSDRTREYVEQWHKEHPWVEMRWVNVPKIHGPARDVDGNVQPGTGFGFDDARNASTEGIEHDWILWIDSDEYLSGVTMDGYCRNNAFDSYAIFQHHFSCEPRGQAPQLDKPARLFRNHQGFEFFGKVHEHAEIGENGGPGFVMVLNDMDIGHTGYVNEQVRLQRFGRNFPLLEWDREVNPDRKIGGYLWLRDMVHRIKILDMQGNKVQARQLAEDAIQFYKSNVEQWGGVGGGQGQNSALAYYSGALEYLGRGAVVTVQMGFEGQMADYVGRFANADEAIELARKGLEEQFKLMQNRYNV